MASLPLPDSVASRTDEVHEPGVFYVDPDKLPPPPPGSVGVRLVTIEGRTIMAGWSVPEHQDEKLLEGAWVYLDMRNTGLSPVSGDVSSSSVRLRLVRD